MANNLKKFQNEADYSAATLNYPAVSWVVSGDKVYFDKTAPIPPTPMLGDLKVTYNVTYTSDPTPLFNGVGSGSGSGSGGGFAPSQMLVDGVEVTPQNTWYFETTGDHVVEFKLAEGETTIPSGAFNMLTNILNIKIGGVITSIGSSAFNYNTSLTSVTIDSGVTSIDTYAFSQCNSLLSITCNAMTAPSIENGTFSGVKSNGTLYVPSGSSGYDVWMQNANYYLGKYNWTKVEQ